MNLEEYKNKARELNEILKNAASYYDSILAELEAIISVVSGKDSALMDVLNDAVSDVKNTINVLSNCNVPIEMRKYAEKSTSNLDNLTHNILDNIKQFADDLNSL